MRLAGGDGRIIDWREKCDRRAFCGRSEEAGAAWALTRVTYREAAGERQSCKCMHLGYELWSISFECTHHEKRRDEHGGKH